MLLAVIKKISRNLLCSSLTTMMMLSHVYAAGGISLGGTRLIYPQDNKQATMPVINSTPDKRFLINSWVENEQGEKVDTVLVTPPMFVSEAKAENTLRVVNTNSDLPKDRESLFYLNVQAIPSVNPAEVENKNVLQLAILSRIKMFIRPKALNIRIEDAPSLIQVLSINQNLFLKNPSPYYMTLVYLEIDGKKLENIMLAPFSETSLKQSGSMVSFQTINDYGAFSERRQIKPQ